VRPIIRQPPKPRLTFAHEVRVGHQEVDEPLACRAARPDRRPNGYKKRTPFWAYTIFAFARQEQHHETRLSVYARMPQSAVSASELWLQAAERS